MEEQSNRPVDVGTGFGLWLAALPLLIVGQGVDTATASDAPAGVIVIALSALFLVMVCAIVLTFLLLMRQGYRWARTFLTGGGVTTIVYVVSSLFTVQRGAVAAVIYATTAIFGSVLVAGGMYLLHRKDAQAFFTR